MQRFACGRERAVAAADFQLPLSYHRHPHTGPGGTKSSGMRIWADAGGGGGGLAGSRARGRASPITSTPVRTWRSSSCQSPCRVSPPLPRPATAVFLPRRLPDWFHLRSQGQHVEILLPMSFRRAHRKMYREYLDRYDRVASAWIPSPIMNRPRKLRIAVRDGGFRDITFTLTDCLVQLGGLGGGVLPVLADSSMPPKTAGNVTSSSATPVASEADAAGGGAPGGRAMPPAQVRFIGIIQEISDAAVQGDDGDSTAQGSCTFMPPEHAAAKSSAPAAPAGPPGAKGWKVESSAGCPAGKGKPKSRGKSHQDAKAACPHMAGKH